MNKLQLFIFTLFFSVLISGVFGIIHDQITYSISEEYYTRFKFIQFGLIDEGAAIPANPRVCVAIVGFLATWWTGLFIGIIYGTILMLFKKVNLSYKIYFRAIAITLLTTLIISIAGYFYGRYFTIEAELQWYFPENLINKSSFIIVGSIHNASYLGGLVGLLFGTFYLLMLKEHFKEKKAISVRKKL